MHEVDAWCVYIVLCRRRRVTTDWEVHADHGVNLQVHRQVGESTGVSGGVEMTVASVDKVLNDIRQYLFADGGDMRVERVEDGKVYVQFEGACASCSSQVCDPID
jgi:hypothetical protein